MSNSLLSGPDLRGMNAVTQLRFLDDHRAEIRDRISALERGDGIGAILADVRLTAAFVLPACNSMGRRRSPRQPSACPEP